MSIPLTQRLTQFIIIWTVEDIFDRCSLLTLDEAEHILYCMERCHDCNTGMTWQHVDILISEKFPAKFKQFQELEEEG